MLQFLFIFFVLLFALALSNKSAGFTLAGKDGKSVYILCFLFLGLLAAFRSPIVGNDTKEYIRIFQDFRDLLDNGTRFEYGYLYYNLFIHKITGNYQVFFIITSIFLFATYGVITWKYSFRPKLAVLFFFILAFPGTVNTMRQSFAICILLFSLDYIIKRRWIFFIFIVLFASLFHVTAIIFLVVYTLSYLRINRMTVLLFVVAALVCYIMFADLLEIGFSYFTMYEYYSQGKYFEGETRVASMVKVVFSVTIFLVAYYSYKRSTKEWKQTIEGKRYTLILLLEMIAVVIDFLSLKVNLLDRLD